MRMKHYRRCNSHWLGQDCCLHWVIRKRARDVTLSQVYEAMAKPRPHHLIVSFHQRIVLKFRCFFLNSICGF